MKIEKVRCDGLTPTLIAKGVTGGGYVAIYSSGSAMIGGKAFAENPNDMTTYVQLTSVKPLYEKPFFLNEGEELYGQGDTGSYRWYYVVYMNPEPTSQTNTQTPPISLTGTIQLNQQ